MSKNRLSRADRKAIQAAIAKANRTNRKEKSAQDSIPFQRMWADGICRTANNHYTKTVQYQDINYQLSQNEDKTAIFEGWSDFLNYAVAALRCGDDIKTVQENLGHHTAAFTLDVYAHVTAQMKTESASRMQSLISSIV